MNASIFRICLTPAIYLYGIDGPCRDQTRVSTERLLEGRLRAGPTDTIQYHVSPLCERQYHE